MREVVIQKDFLLKKGVSHEPVLEAISNCAKREICKMLAEIIVLEFDLRETVGLSPREALKEALADNGIVLSSGAVIDQYTHLYAKDKVTALYKILTEIVNNPNYRGLFTTADKSYGVSFINVHGMDFVRLETKQDDYFCDDTFLSFVEYEVEGPTTEMRGAVSNEQENKLETVSKQELSDFFRKNGGKYSDKCRRACMLLTNRDFTKMAETVNGWKWANVQKNFDKWLSAREEVAAKLLGNLAWAYVLDERIPTSE